MFFFEFLEGIIIVKLLSLRTRLFQILNVDYLNL